MTSQKPRSERWGEMKFVVANTPKDVADYTCFDLLVRKVSAEFAAIIVFETREEAELACASLTKATTVISLSNVELNSLKKRFRNEQVDWLFELNNRYFKTAEEI